MRKIQGLFLFFWVWSAVSTAQTPASATGRGTVTGHVTCGDTQRPARFAGVVLYGIPAEVTATPTTPPDSKDATTAKGAVRTALGNVTLSQGQTGLDGSFALTDVPPGDYYAFASLAGYVQPASVIEAAYANGADLHKPVPGIPQVHVAADGTATLELTVQRGAAITGRVMWDDGTPVARAVVTVETPGSGPSRSQLPPQFTMLTAATLMTGGSSMITDDQGRFRLAGLLPGPYVVKASLTTGGQFGMVGGAMQLNANEIARPLVMYAPATVHRTEAKTIAVTAGEEHGGEEITVNLGGMHSVSGTVRSAEDGHGVNSASVTLTDASDKNFQRGAGVDANGAFTVTLLPPGTYDVLVEGAADTRPSAKKSTGLMRLDTPETVRSYDEGKASVVVTSTDITGQVISLQPEAGGTQKAHAASASAP